MKGLFLIVIFSYTFTVFAQQNDSVNSINYNPDAGLQIKIGDFQWTTWAFAERLFSTDKEPVWRRVRQGMEMLLPAYPFKISKHTYRTALVYEVDFTDNDFFRASKQFKIWENLFVTFQNSADPNKFRILFGENTHILSREDNLSSGNLPSINRSLILEEHGSTNSFGTQWGFQYQTLLNPNTFLQVSLQDNRGSLNQDDPMFQFWNDIAIKITQSVLQTSDKSNQKLNIGFALDHTRNITSKEFTLISGINQDVLGSTSATGNKLTLENNLDYTNVIGKHFYTLEYETIYSNYSHQKLNVFGGYAQVQFQIFDKKQFGDLVPFARYDLVSLSSPAASATEQAIKLGLNYNFPFTGTLVNFHLEYAHHILNGSQAILTSKKSRFDEFRFELRVNAVRYLRF